MEQILFGFCLTGIMGFAKIGSLIFAKNKQVRECTLSLVGKEAAPMTVAAEPLAGNSPPAEMVAIEESVVSLGEQTKNLSPDWERHPLDIE
jgi:hypothetical protein